MEEGDLIIKYKVEQGIDSVLDQKIRDFLKTLGYKWKGSGFYVQENIRDISFTIGDEEVEDMEKLAKEDEEVEEIIEEIEKIIDEEE